MSCVHIRQIDFYTATVIPKFPYFKRGRAEINATKKSYIKQQKAMEKKENQQLCQSRWPSWALRPNELSGFRGHKELLNRASALVTTCP